MRYRKNKISFGTSCLIGYVYKSYQHLLWEFEAVRNTYSAYTIFHVLVCIINQHIHIRTHTHTHTHRERERERERGERESICKGGI